MGNRGLVLSVICAEEYIKKNNSHFSNAQELINTKHSLYQQEQQTTSISHFHLLSMEVHHESFKGNLPAIAPGSMFSHTQLAGTHMHSCIMCWQVTEKLSKHI